MRHPALLLVSLLCPPVLAQATWSQLYPATLPPIGDVALMAGHDASGSVLLL